MTALLKGIKSLIRRNEGLADNLWATEIKHYAAEIEARRRLRHPPQAKSVSDRIVPADGTGAAN